VAVVLVTGATGTLGNALVPRLVGQQHQVRVLLHRSSADFPPEVQVARGDVRSLADLAGAVDGVDTVIHAATSPFRQAMETELEGIRAVLAAAGRPAPTSSTPRSSASTASAAPTTGRNGRPSSS